jgi:hypothetical protein
MTSSSDKFFDFFPHIMFAGYLHTAGDLFDAVIVVLALASLDLLYINKYIHINAESSDASGLGWVIEEGFKNVPEAGSVGYRPSSLYCTNG